MTVTDRYDNYLFLVMDYEAWYHDNLTVFSHNLLPITVMFYVQKSCYGDIQAYLVYLCEACYVRYGVII